MRSTTVTSGRVFPCILSPNPRISLCLMQASSLSESFYKPEQDERSSTWLCPAAACALRGLGANLTGRGRSWGPDPTHVASPTTICATTRKLLEALKAAGTNLGARQTIQPVLVFPLSSPKLLGSGKEQKSTTPQVARHCKRHCHTHLSSHQGTHGCLAGNLTQVQLCPAVTAVFSAAPLANEALSLPWAGTPCIVQPAALPRPRRCFLDVCAFLPEFCFVVCWYRALALGSHMNVHEGIACFFSKAFRWRASGFLSRGHPGCCSWWSQTPSDRGIGLLVTCGAANCGLQHPCTSPGLPTTPPCCLLDSQGLCPSTGTSHTPGTLTAAPLRTARLQPIPGASTGSHVETAAGFHGSLSKEITARCTCRYGAEHGAEPSFPCLPPPRSAEIPTHTSSRIQLHTDSHHAAQVIAFTFSLHSHRST